MNKETVGISERPNELTTDIDIANSVEILRMFRQTDSQIFNGYKHFPALLDRETLGTIHECINQACKVINSSGKRVIIMSGAGTSGRLGMITSRAFNNIMQKHGDDSIFTYLIAGGNLALIKAQEGAEDDPNQAVDDLKALTDGADSILYIGITCGFSAPYIGGQLDYLMEKENAFSILLGFNPVELARDHDVENWDRTFRQVVEKTAKHPRCAVLNPIIGPEPVTGSTRMKGGSATKMLLETIFTTALLSSGRIFDNHKHPVLRDKKYTAAELVDKCLTNYDIARLAAYRVRDNIAKMMDLAGNALRNSAHIYYLGSNTIGSLGTVDASECPPTFGADFEDVRGFIRKGWEGLLGEGEEDLSHVGSEYRINWADFKAEKLPYLKEDDLVIGIADGTAEPELLEILKEASGKGAHVAAIVCNSQEELPDFIKYRIEPKLVIDGFIAGHHTFTELTLKLVLNAITTAAHIFTGKVYKNKMVDLRISNNKLYFRTLRIIMDIIGCDAETAREALLRSIYETDVVLPEHRDARISQYVDISTPKQKIVPIALLLATGLFSYEMAKDALASDPIIRNIVMEHDYNEQ